MYSIIDDPNKQNILYCSVIQQIALQEKKKFAILKEKPLRYENSTNQILRYI